MIPPSFQVSRPEDARNPIPREVLNARPRDTAVIYHGTGKEVISHILDEGFRARKDDSLRRDVETIVSVFVEFYYFGEGGPHHGFIALSILSRELERTQGVVRPHFSGSYATARNYAILNGGESTVGIIGALNDFELLATNTRVRDKHRKWIEEKVTSVYHGSPEWKRYREVLCRLAEPSRLNEAWAALRPLRESHVLNQKAKRHVPVVVAVTADRKAFGFLPTPLDVTVPALSPIPPNRILAMAELPVSSVRVEPDNSEILDSLDSEQQ